MHCPKKAPPYVEVRKFCASLIFILIYSPVKMAAEERRKYILSMLEQYGSVTVSELSEHFGISEVSVRKLLISLEQEMLT